MSSWLSRLLGRSERRDDLAAERHHQLSTMVPFPADLNWHDLAAAEKNLEALRAYAQGLATSVIDWYLRKRRWKKIFSWALRLLAYAFAIVRSPCAPTEGIERG